MLLIWVNTKATYTKKPSIFKILDKARNDAFLQYKLNFFYNQTYN